MTDFEPISSLRPFHKSLIDDLCDVLNHLHQDNAHQYLETLVILPTRRAVKDLKFALSDRGREASFLPRILSVLDLPCTIFGDNPDTLSEPHRLALAYTTLKELGETPSFPYARDLLQLRDQMITHHVDINHLEHLVPETYAEHWQHTSSFLQTFIQTWEHVLKTHKHTEQSLWDRDAFAKLSAFWAQHPPQTPVIAAGLDGFIPAIRTLLTDIIALPQGHVLWTGVLPKTNDKTIAKTHPNYLFSQQAKSLNHDEATLHKRSHTLSHVFSDTPYDDRDLGGLTFTGLSLYQGESLSQEAEMVALLARETLEDPHKTIAIVTPDPNLTKHIQNELALYNIRVDVAGGTSNLDTPEARYGLHLLDTRLFVTDPLSALSLLKNPLTTWPYKQNLMAQEGAIRSNRSVDMRSIAAPFDDLVRDFVTLSTQNDVPLSGFNAGWHNLLTILAPDVKATPLYQDLFVHLKALEPLLPALTITDYKALVTLLFSETVQRESINHPRVRLMSPIQSAFSRFDRVILAGLNEGIWPTTTPDNPWLNLDMQVKLGLPDTQETLGRGAWLLAQNMRSPEVILTYADRRGGDPATPSRWILRLQALEQALNTQNPHHKAGTLLLDPHYQQYLDKKNHPRSQHTITEPHPCPPLHTRPKRFSITDIERLLCDPYQIYAKSVLNLHPLQDIKDPKTHADFGTFIHGCLEDHIRLNKPFHDLIQVNLTRLQQGQSVYGVAPPDASLQILWQKTIATFEPWLTSVLQDQKTVCTNSIVETSLNTTIDHPQHPFTIVGKADRIDQLADGTYEIIDYKTGHTPSKRDVITGESPQLALLGRLFMLANPGTAVSKLTYISLGSQTISSFEAPTIIDNTWAHVLDILTHYQDPTTPFEINVLSSLRDPYNRYQHLERTTEWLDTKQASILQVPQKVAS